MTILDDVRALLAEGPLCDACLGRVFAERSHGLTNAERGRSLRVTLALVEDEPFDPFAARDASCWVCEGLCGDPGEWADRAAAAIGDVELETYQVGTRVPPLIDENDRLLREAAGLSPDVGEAFKSECNREVGRRLGRQLGAEVDFERPDVLVLLDLATETVEVQVNSAFVYGRYRKLERDIPQTEWPCRECDGRGTTRGAPCEHCDGTGYLYEHSVEGYVAPHVEAAMDGAEAVFHGAGREDVDARMLGDGRPFVVEVKEPRRRFPDLTELERTIDDAADGAVEVRDLAFATHDMVERVKELPASKTYRATVEFDESVEQAAFDAALRSLDGATIEQDTPDRVAHRRAAKTRIRTVYAADGTLEDPTHAVVEVHGEGGLYVKELISGDAGRTRPSLADELDVGATVTALDVLAVAGEEEPFTDPAFLREPLEA